MTATHASRFLDLETVARLARLRFGTRYAVEAAYPGRHASHRPGGSLEFADFRPYTPGEDLRKLDWKVMARLGRAYVRTYQEDTQLLCTIALDSSGSMAFPCHLGPGALSKLDYARYLAASLAYVIDRGGDQVGLAVLGDRLVDCLPPAAAPTQLQSFLRMLEETPRPDASPTRLRAGLLALLPLLPTRGVLVVVGDFLDDDLEGVFGALRLFRHRHFEVLLLHLVHPQEEHLPEGRCYRFQGLEGEGEIVGTPAEIAAAYERRFAGFLATVKTLAVATGCDYRRLSTATSTLRSLETLLVERSR
ncbi:MAG: DUF58 domain-containing protein [Candidatus Riflebacteria bacterium]|nr:DUF58 domain-containing protein [Candidatus Riflebacteria bacterium]